MISLDLASSPFVQVEAANGAACKLYEEMGYGSLHTTDEARSLRLAPSTSFVNALLPIENEALLREEPTTLVTMGKHVAVRE